MNERHEKWVAVEPGTVIPAGQPYRIEYCIGERPQSIETQADTDRIANKHDEHSDARHSWFIDSSWRPPLELPETPTWGLVVRESDVISGLWFLNAEFIQRVNGGSYRTSDVLDFIKCTPEQVARIEGRR